MLIPQHIVGFKNIRYYCCYYYQNYVYLLHHQIQPMSHTSTLMLGQIQGLSLILSSVSFGLSPLITQSMTRGSFCHTHITSCHRQLILQATSLFSVGSHLSQYPSLSYENTIDFINYQRFLWIQEARPILGNPGYMPIPLESRKDIWAQLSTTVPL